MCIRDRHITYPMIAFMQHKDGETFLYNSFLNIECLKEGYDLNLCYTTLIEKENCYDLHHINIYKPVSYTHLIKS